MVLFQTWISRGDLRANRGAIYLFGDNVMRKGLGGQAREMRGEPNAIGVVTKHAPGRTEQDYFDDKDFDYLTAMIAFDLRRAFGWTRRGGLVVVPLDGLGTGLAELPQRAPRINVFLEEQIQHLVSGAV